ncbi:hypothetical protein PR048_029361 [Dryococelus australis]|uniref:Uncharacterized protein n=1 Tax=Dryococelus australis TaxID=614101 RepID=A0ABQ9GD54_9NEOP|nr:hypothetical protein PR048_029361 [Dryococelus australis]
MYCVLADVSIGHSQMRDVETSPHQITRKRDEHKIIDVYCSNHKYPSSETCPRSWTRGLDGDSENSLYFYLRGRFILVQPQPQESLFEHTMRVNRVAQRDCGGRTFSACQFAWKGVGTRHEKDHRSNGDFLATKKKKKPGCLHVTSAKLYSNTQHPTANTFVTDITGWPQRQFAHDKLFASISQLLWHKREEIGYGRKKDDAFSAITRQAGRECRTKPRAEPKTRLGKTRRTRKGKYLFWLTAVQTRDEMFAHGLHFKSMDSSLAREPVIEASVEQRRNERAGETGDPREDPPTNGIVRHDSHMRKSVLCVLEPASFLHWLLHRCEFTPFLNGVHVIGPYNCEVFVYWRRVSQAVSNKVWSNDKRIAKDKMDFKRLYTEITFAIGTEFIRHALDDSAPIADLQGNKKRIPHCQIIEFYRVAISFRKNFTSSTHQLKFNSEACHTYIAFALTTGKVQRPLSNAERTNAKQMHIVQASNGVQQNTNRFSHEAQKGSGRASLQYKGCTLAIRASVAVPLLGVAWLEEAVGLSSLGSNDLGPYSLKSDPPNTGWIARACYSSAMLHHWDATPSARGWIGPFRVPFRARTSCCQSAPISGAIIDNHYKPAPISGAIIDNHYKPASNTAHCFANLHLCTQISVEIWLTEYHIKTPVSNHRYGPLHDINDGARKRIQTYARSAAMSASLGDTRRAREPHGLPSTFRDTVTDPRDALPPAMFRVACDTCPINCSTTRTNLDFRRIFSRIFACGNRARTMLLVGWFSEGSHVSPRSVIPALLHTSLHPRRLSRPRRLRAAQISITQVIDFSSSVSLAVRHLRGISLQRLRHLEVPCLNPAQVFASVLFAIACLERILKDFLLAMHDRRVASADNTSLRCSWRVSHAPTRLRSSNIDPFVLQGDSDALKAHKLMAKMFLLGSIQGFEQDSQGRLLVAGILLFRRLETCVC